MIDYIWNILVHIPSQKLKYSRNCYLITLCIFIPGFGEHTWGIICQVSSYFCTIISYNCCFESITEKEFGAISTVLRKNVHYYPSRGFDIAHLKIPCSELAS